MTKQSSARHAHLMLQSGAVVVFEGLDKAGKSTQLDRLRAKTDPAMTLFAHMPSGHGLPADSRFTDGVYDLLENHGPASGLGRQLAHLACHCEHMPALIDAVQSNAVVLDRWWWSTMAYGWYGQQVQSPGVTEATFRDLIDTIWAPVRASIVFLFLSPHEVDANNLSGVEAGYRELASRHEGEVHLVPALPEGETFDYIVQALDVAGLATLRSDQIP